MSTDSSQTAETELAASHSTQGSQVTDIDEASATQAVSGVVEMAARTPSNNGAASLFPRITQGGSGAAQNDIDMVMEIPVELTVELGRTKVPIGNVLQLAHGSVIELDAMASEPMDVYVNGLLIAQGEVVIVNDKFGLRLTDIVTPAERIRRLGKR